MMTPNRFFDTEIDDSDTGSIRQEAFEVKSWLAENGVKVSESTLYKIKSGESRSWMSGYLPVSKLTVKAR